MTLLRLTLSILLILLSVFFLYRAARYPSNRLMDSLFGFGFLLSGGSDLVAPDGSSLELWIDGLGTLVLLGAIIKLFFFSDLKAIGAKKP